MTVNIDELLAALTLEEKAALTAGDDFFTLQAVDRLGIPKIGVTDGPSGARGVGLPGSDDPASNCVPCGTALGATWDPDVTEQIGAVIGRDVRGQACRGLLAPTVNLHRSPLAGRNFECWSEDPWLTGTLAAAFVRGAQAEGVFATVKHFIGNEAEFERNTIDSVIDERSLRELYLLPFEMVLKDGGAMGVMTSYNRMNGTWLNEQPQYLLDLLRDEWGFEGLVMTDWFAAVHPERSIASGLDLEMPGPGRGMGATLVQAVEDGRVAEADLDAAVRRLLGVYDWLGVLGSPRDPLAPLPESTETNGVLRAAGAAGMVLLTNTGVLPLDPSALKSVAIIGPRAVAPAVTGGGSAQLNSHRVLRPADELTAALGAGVKVSTLAGVCDPTPTPFGSGWLNAPEGFVIERFAGTEWQGEPVKRTETPELHLFSIALSSSDPWSARVTGVVVPEETGTYELLMAQAGVTRVWLDDRLVLDGVDNAPPPGGTEFFGMGSKDLVVPYEFTAGVPVRVRADYVTAATGSLAGFRVASRPADEEGVMRRAVEAAAACDVPVLIVGSNGDHETEGRDRTHLRLPGRQDELIERVAAVNPRTVVVLNTGSVYELPWADKVAAVLMCWFGGQQMGGAIADVLVGRAEPGGRLPTTIPHLVQHNPSYDNFPGENGQVRYGEGLFMGYRGYEHRAIEPHFAFGHGLGYTTFFIGAATVSSGTFRAGEKLVVSVPVTNTGRRAGSEVVQVYVAAHQPRLQRPLKELKGFAKVHLAPGESRTVEIELDDRSFSYWDPGQADWDSVTARSSAMFMAGKGPERRAAGWQLDAGTYDIVVGRSVADIGGTCGVTVVD
jgi:beta-glucosidase